MVFFFSCLRRIFLIFCITESILAGFVMPVYAERISKAVSVFSGLDKITGQIITFNVKIGETYHFGALQITPRICYTGSRDEAARINGFVEVDEVTLERKKRRIFSGWMFADSPGLNAIEHPIYDVWLKDCK